MTSARCRNTMYQAKSRAKARHVCARIEATTTAQKNHPCPVSAPGARSFQWSISEQQIVF